MKTKKVSINKKWFNSKNEAEQQVERRNKGEKVFFVSSKNKWFVGSEFEWLNL